MIRNGQGFCVMILELFFRELRWIHLAQECEIISFKKYLNWCKELADFEVPNKIQSREYSTDGGVDGFLHENESVLWAVNCNWNDDGWNVNANPIDDLNEWNDGNRVFSRNSNISPAIWQEFSFPEVLSSNLQASFRFLQVLLKDRYIFY